MDFVWFFSCLVSEKKRRGSSVFARSSANRFFFFSKMKLKLSPSLPRSLSLSFTLSRTSSSGPHRSHHRRQARPGPGAAGALSRRKRPCFARVEDFLNRLRQVSDECIPFFFLECSEIFLSKNYKVAQSCAAALLCILLLRPPPLSPPMKKREKKLN